MTTREYVLTVLWCIAAGLVAAVSVVHHYSMKPPENLHINAAYYYDDVVFASDGQVIKIWMAREDAKAAKHHRR